MGKFSFYHDEPLFGLDIGYASFKAVQMKLEDGKKPEVLAYGIGGFKADAISNGVIVKPDLLAEAFRQLASSMTGQLTAESVACALPTSHIFSRPMRLPAMADDDIAEAVRLEAEQYIPVPPDNLYLDFEISYRDAQGTNLLMMAAPKNIIDSYLQFFNQLRIKPVALEPAVNASSRLYKLLAANDNPVILIDIGSVAIDIAVFERAVMVSSTVAGGGETMTDLIAKQFKTSREEATKLKVEHGLAYHSNQLTMFTAMTPLLDSLIREVRKIVRYYQEHINAQRKISAIVTTGGGSNMPGLNEFLSRELRLPASKLDPWQRIEFGNLTPPSDTDRAIFLTAAGEAILSPKEVAHD